jgi:hypothetical protein
MIDTKALFIRLIIRFFQFVFSVGTVSFSHNKSANSVFQLAYQPEQSLIVIVTHVVQYPENFTASELNMPLGCPQRRSVNPTVR